jgi:DNA-binding CsgD family transcriptional regulator
MGAKQIANVMNVEPKTVFNHQQNIRQKLHLFNRENLKTHLVRLDVSGKDGD